MRDIEKIYQKFLISKCSPEEATRLWEYFQSKEGKVGMKKLIEATLEKEPILENWDLIDESTILKNKTKLLEQIQLKSPLNDQDFLKQKKPVTSILSIRIAAIRRWSTVAAILVTLIATGTYIYLERSETKTQLSSIANDIPPGGDRATLTLEDGSTIALSEVQSGIIIDSDNIKYNDGSSILISTEENGIAHQQNSTAVQQLTLSTPKGGQYQIILPDGTKVWLNAASTLKYPTRFIGAERRVELSGEAYFEVSQVLGATKIPFIVTSDNQEVIVLGTHFNINAYSGEKATKTTLIEGSVSVSPNLSSRGTKDLYKSDCSTILKPNQQSTLISGKNKLSVKTIDPEAVIAWKNNLFMFESERIETIMKMVERWYDIEIEYVGEIPDERFGGSVSRYDNVSAVLKTLESTGKVSFKIIGRRIIVMK